MSEDESHDALDRGPAGVTSNQGQSSGVTSDQGQSSSVTSQSSSVASSSAGMTSSPPSSDKMGTAVGSQQPSASRDRSAPIQSMPRRSYRVNRQPVWHKEYNF